MRQFHRLVEAGSAQLQYTGFNNLELRLRIHLLQGDAGTDFGEKLASRKVELHARYYF